jgi:Low iron-inducible periplasmic protein
MRFQMVMTVIGHMERAIENCVANKEALSSLDQAVAYYTGSDEGQLTGGTASGWVLHNHADRRCGGFKTCGANRDAVNGTAKVNFEMAEVFNNMKTALTAKNCAAAKTAATTGMATLLIPQIQGALRYTRVLNTRTNYTGHETAEAEGASFAAGVLPMIGACNPAAATTIWSNLRFKIASPPNLVAVKAAFESTYKCLGITCADVGGQWNGTQYLTDAGPCVDVVAPTPVAVPAPTPATAPKAPTPTAPSAPKAPSAAAPAAAPVKPTESVGPIRRIIRRIRKFFGNLFG